jgi:hypothetical protein
MGSSMSPVFLTLPTSENALVPLDLLGAHGGEPGAAVGDDGADAGPGLDVVEHRGQIEEALVGGVHVLGARLAGLALQRPHEGRGLAAHEGAAAAGDADVEARNPSP